MQRGPRTKPVLRRGTVLEPRPRQPPCRRRVERSQATAGAARTAPGPGWSTHTKFRRRQPTVARSGEARPRSDTNPPAGGSSPGACSPQRACRARRRRARRWSRRANRDRAPPGAGFSVPPPPRGRALPEGKLISPPKRASSRLSRGGPPAGSIRRRERSEGESGACCCDLMEAASIPPGFSVLLRTPTYIRMRAT